MDPTSDAAVIESSLEVPGDFATIFDRHAAVVFRFLVRRVGRDIADELLGETFRIAFEKRPSYDLSRDSARPWLYGIATNLVAKHRRTEARRLRASSRLGPSRGVEFPADSVVASVDAGSLWPLVVEAIASLPDGERDALLLYAWEELGYDEIAAALDVPVGTVRSRLNRARRRLNAVRLQPAPPSPTTSPRSPDRREPDTSCGQQQSEAAPTRIRP